MRYFFFILIGAATVGSLSSCVHPQEEKSMSGERQASSLSCAEGTWSSAPQNLALVQASVKPGHSEPSQVQFELQGDVLVASFTVIASEIYAKNPLPPGEFPYQYDVVEVFIAVSGSQDNFPYYEFEVSPYNETFQVLIELTNGKRHGTSPIDMGIATKATLTPTGWTAELRIPLKNLPWTGKPKDIIGNAFTILGKGKKRSYWSLSLPPQKKANFHHPEFFRPLLTCR